MGSSLEIHVRGEGVWNWLLHSQGYFFSCWSNYVELEDWLVSLTTLFLSIPTMIYSFCGAVRLDLSVSNMIPFDTIRHVIPRGNDALGLETDSGSKEKSTILTDGDDSVQIAYSRLSSRG